MVNVKVTDVNYPQGKIMTGSEMVEYAKRVLSINKRNGYDKGLRQIDLNRQIIAQKYLKSIGIKLEVIPDRPKSKPVDKRIKAFIKSGLNNPWLSRQVDIDDGEFVTEDWLESNSFTIVSNVDELINKLKRGNWAINQAFVLGDFAFINQVNGRDEWATFKYDEKTDSAFQFESISAIPMIRDNEFKSWYTKVRKASNQQLKRLDY